MGITSDNGSENSENKMRNGETLVFSKKAKPIRHKGPILVRNLRYTTTDEN